MFFDGKHFGFGMYVSNIRHLHASEGGSKAIILSNLELIPVRVAEGGRPNGRAVAENGLADGFEGRQERLFARSP